MDPSLVGKPALSTLSLEKYAAIVSVLKGGHDLASSIPLGELKEVHHLNEGCGLACMHRMNGHTAIIKDNLPRW